MAGSLRTATGGAAQVKVREFPMLHHHRAGGPATRSPLVAMNHIGVMLEGV